MRPDDGPPPLLPGASIAAGYDVVAHLRRGRRLDVYDAWSEERWSRCVVKTLRPDLLGDRDATTRLLREGRLLARMAHPHIVRCYEVIREPRPAVVLETLSGEALDHVLEERSPRLSLSEAAWLGLHLRSALGYLHARGWLHLDVKPSNVVCAGGRATMIDLSIARRPGRAGRADRPEGTPDYMAPEQVTGERLTEATDVWGLGALLFESLAGEPPFERALPDRDERSDASSEDGLYPQTTQRAPSIGSFRRLPRPLRDVLDACLDPDPKRRPSLEALQRELVRATGEHPKWATDAVP
jgi:serine/threonine protein kinase